MMVLMLGVSVNGQKLGNSKRLPPVITYDQDINIEDEVTGSFLIIDPQSGEYKFHRCSDGFSLSGFGVVKIDGCAITFEDLTAGRRVLVSIDECNQLAKASVQTFAIKGQVSEVPLVKETLSDANMRDNTMSCAPKARLE
jgi:hypothetical protein